MKSTPKSFEGLIEALQSLPALGRKSAIKLAYHMLIENPSLGARIAHAIEHGLHSIQKCSMCGNVSEHELCEICADEERNNGALCLVLNPKDIIVLEQTGAYKGKYFVIYSINDTDELIHAVSHNINEVIFAFTPSVESDGLIVLLEERLKAYSLKFTKIAQGVPTGISLENVDTISLSKALNGRTIV